jgi:uncharacterized protein (TIGR03437 family)
MAEDVSGTWPAEVNSIMRSVLLLLLASALFGQQPIIYFREAVNAASYAPFGLPNAPVARGSIFTVFGENLGPVKSPGLTFPLSTTLGGVSISVTQNGVVTQTFPIFVAPTQINAVMPSTVKAGLATLRLTYQSQKSNAITIQIADSAPGVLAVSGGGYGPGIVQNFITESNDQLNSLVAPAAPGGTVVIWGTGLGPVTFPDNEPPTTGNVSTPVTITIGGQLAKNLYSGRAPCCSGLDQIVATLPANVPLGCWVPISINAGGVVSNTTTIAIAAPGATSCDDPANPLSKLVRTPGTQAFINLNQVDNIQNVETPTPLAAVQSQLYSRFFTRPNSPYNFDPYMSYPPAGTCLVHQTSGDANLSFSLPGTLPASASLNPQPTQAYNSGATSPTGAFLAGTIGATVGATVYGEGLLTANATFTVDPGGPNQTVLAIPAETPPAWTRPKAIIAIPRSAPLALSFTPGDPAAPTAIVLYAYTTSVNATVEVECLAAPGASTFTISADNLSNLPPSYRLIDGSYAYLMMGALGVNKGVAFSSGLAAQGILISSSWLSQEVILQ